MATIGQGSTARVVITIDGLGDRHVSDSDVSMEAVFYIRGKRTSTALDAVTKDEMVKQTSLADTATAEEIAAAESNSYLAVVDTAQFDTTGSVYAEIKVVYPADGKQITEIIPDVSTGITTKTST